MRGAGLGTAVVLVFGGIDAAQGEISARELAGTFVWNGLIGGLLGYALAPTGWRRIPFGSGR